MASQESVVLVDVDNTLLDNDRVINDLKRHIEQQHLQSLEDCPDLLLQSLLSVV